MFYKSFVAAISISLIGCGIPMHSTVSDSSNAAPSQYQNFSTIIALSKDYLSLNSNETYIEPVHQEGWRNGAYTWSDGNRNIRVELDLVASLNQLAIDTLVFTTTDLTSRSNSSQQGVNANWWSQATISTGSRAGIRLNKDNDNAFSLARTNANANLRITGTNIQANGLFARAKKRQAREKIMSGVSNARHQLASEAVRVSDTNLNARIREAVNKDSIATLKDQIQTQKMATNGSSRLHLATTSTELQIGLRSSIEMNLAPIPTKSDKLVRLHASDVNAIFAAKFAGQTLSESEIASKFEDVLGKKTTPSTSTTEEESGLITFAPKDPVTLTVENGGVTITLRATEFDTGRLYKLPMNITLHYTVKNKGGLTLERGDLPEVLPPEYTSGSTRLSRKQKILIEELTDVFHESFDPVFVESSETIAGKTSNRTLVTTQISAENGWLLINKVITK